MHSTVRNDLPSWTGDTHVAILLHYSLRSTVLQPKNFDNL